MNPSVILLVEDDRASRLAMRILLQRAGYKVVDASTVEDGRHAIDQDNIFVLVLDLMLPDGSGEELIEKARLEGGIRVIVMTGVGDPERIKRVQQMHPDAMLFKPVTGSDLLRQIKGT